MTSQNLTEEQIDELRETFRLFDKDHNGYITIQELCSIMKMFSRPCTLNEAKEMMLHVDKNNDGIIDFREFLELMSPLIISNNIDDTYLWGSFNFFDKDKDGNITSKELKIVLQSLHLKLTDSEIDEMIHEADIDKNGTISFEEFKLIMNKHKK
ncbi:unnamed protein product [Heterobilharzia americana]|nr:unnamed protein product [Heterobilharzia americana]CAH8572645.1 unnamed protein product [Heterobilharzia americana]